MPLTRIVYTSRAMPDIARADLEDILETARRRNAEQGITGYLLYDDGQFIQAIEGEPASVEALVERIERDPRHDALEIVARERIGQREFGDWSMGWFHVDNSCDHDAARLRSAMRDFLSDSGEGVREAIGFFRLLLRFERETGH